MILRMELGSDSYDIVIERGCLEKAGEYLNLNRKVLIVTDDGVPEMYAQEIANQAKSPVIMTLPQGEATKQMDYFSVLLESMLENGFTRKDCVVACGGGVMGDLAGFAASCYMRGIDFYNCPTTVLSQIDSSIGGKTAIDFCGIKNIVGTFYQPEKVLIDPEVLNTLPHRQISNGLAEAVKMAAFGDEELFELFENEDPLENIDTIIEKSLKIKKYVVEQDEKEAGLRKILNFGHTIGHGIEANAPDMYHGECVALGTLAMSSETVRERLRKIYEKLDLPTEITLDKKKVMEAIKHDKKTNATGVDGVLVNEIGSYEIVKMSYKEIEQRLPVCIKQVGEQA